MKEVTNLILIGVIVVLGSYILYDKAKAKGELNTNARVVKVYPEGQKVFTFDVPSNLNFAGERVPIENYDIKERYDREIHINTYWHSSTLFMIKRANRWFPVIEPILQKNGVPNDFKYLALIESSLTNAISPANAVGFWQLLKATAKERGLEVSSEVDERYHPVKSTEAACRYLLRAYEKFGNWTNVAASYNMGVAGLTRRLNEQKVTSYYDLLLNEETSRYVFRALALKEIMENPGKYGYEIPSEHLYANFPIKEVKVTSTISNLVDFSNSLGINYKTLKLYNPWLRKQRLSVRRGKFYIISLPHTVSDELIAEINRKGEKGNNGSYNNGQTDEETYVRNFEDFQTQPQ
ncbi:lytic transglycosylase domain-containing protein [Fulvivirgaceae bacterium BMA10]|uniref:Lytic transglycosylase domain-containing protein n=1 Tax=Splendidivirga corallicola TaxID=3051826 RepID=A0ABT8KTB2_9BACT|nr:lytic transglycosylase domain-containing protein [Fulvivirgaceae bacterium BMA10]